MVLCLGRRGKVKERNASANNEWFKGIITRARTHHSRKKMLRFFFQILLSLSFSFTRAVAVSCVRATVWSLKLVNEKILFDLVDTHRNCNQFDAISCSCPMNWTNVNRMWNPHRRVSIDRHKLSCFGFRSLLNFFATVRKPVEQQTRKKHRTCCERLRKIVVFFHFLKHLNLGDQVLLWSVHFFYWLLLPNAIRCCLPDFIAK